MSHGALAVRVECYAGHRGEQEPRRFYIGERGIEVDEIVDRWLAPDHRYFRVRGSDRGSYILRHDVTADRWELTFFERHAQS